MTVALPTSEFQQLTKTYEEAGLRPLLDPVLEMVLIDCPSCHAQDTDPLGLWRPLQVVPRAKVTIHHCTACARHDER